MKTKCIVIGNQPKEEEKKSIKLSKYLACDLIFEETEALPSQFKNIELISKNYADGYDLIFGYDEDRNDEDHSVLYLGYWNDGVAE